MKHSLGARWRAPHRGGPDAERVFRAQRSQETVERQPARDGQRAAAVARGKIEVDGGLVALAPALAGTVASLTVREGDRVQRGQLLLAQASQVSSAAVAVATSELKLARAQQAAEGRLPELKQAAARYAQAVRAGPRSPSWPMTRSSVCATPSPTWRWPRLRRRSRSSAWNRPRSHCSSSSCARRRTA